MNPHLIRAKILMGQERWEMALEELREALAVDPLNSHTHCRIALVLLRLDRWSEARRAVDTALEHGPEDSQVHWTSALVYLDREHWTEADRAIRTATELDPEDADYHGLRARILFEQKKHAEALAEADAGLALDATNDLSLTYRARVLSALGRHEEAGEVTEALLREDPLDAWNHCLRGEDLLLKGRTDEAREHFLESLRLQPGNDTARAGFALALKAQSPIYGAVLALLVRTSRMKAPLLWGGLIAVMLILQFGSRLVTGSPTGIVGFAIAKEVVYSGFVLLFIANPMFDLILRFHPEGRHVLSRDEKRATTWYIICFVIAGLYALWTVTSPTFSPKFYGYATLFLCAPIRLIFETKSRYVRRRLAGLTIVLAFLMFLAPLAGAIGMVLAIRAGQTGFARVMLGYVLFIAPAVMLYSSFAGSIRQWLEKRRSD